MNRKKDKKQSKYLNCSPKGVISLFMAVLLTPFLSIAMVLIEAGRYNSAVSVLDEAMGVSSTSTLADYDDYLHSRWGLLAMDQKHNIDADYSEFLEKNAEILGNTLSLTDAKAEGIYSLADDAVFQKQIMEYCKLNAPTKIAEEFVLSDIVKKLEGFKNIDKIFSMVTSGADAVDSTITLAESAENLKEAANELEILESEYHNSYQSFSSAVDQLIAALNEPEPEESDYEDEDGELDRAAYEAAVEEWQENIDNAREGANHARDTYADVIGKTSSCMEKYKSKMEACVSAQGTIANSIVDLATTSATYVHKTSESNKTLQALQSDIKKMEKSDDFNPDSTEYLEMKDWEQALSEEVSESYTQQSVAKAMETGLSTVNAETQECFSKYSDATFGAAIEGLKNLKNTVEAFDANGITENSSSISEDVYHSVTIGSYVKADEIDAYLDEMEQELLSGSLKSLLKGLLGFLESIVSMSGFYEPALSSVIDVNYYNSAFEGLPGADGSEGGIKAVIDSIKDTMQSVENFKNELSHFKFLDALREIKEAINHVKQTFVAIAQFGKDICENIANLFTGYEQLYVTAYSTFNLPCRTDYKIGKVSFSAMPGENLGAGDLPQKAGIQDYFNSLKTAIDAISSRAEAIGKDITFCGAELEYILYGSHSEVSNQLYTFFALYLFKMLPDALSVLKNPEVQSLASASTFGYPLVMALIILAEPLVDTLLLVNGAEVALLKSTVYLSPSGLPGLVEKLLSVVKFTAEQTENVKTGLVNAFGATEDDYKYQSALNTNKSLITNSIADLTEFNYREYCFMVMLLSVTKEQQYARLKNLVQMETLYHYNTEGADAAFDLRLAYTNIHCTASADVRQMLPSLIDSSIFSVEREIYRGY